MFFLVGLGNPGKKYASTRHNAGKMLAAWLRAEGGLEDFEILETDCYMNQSGQWLKTKMATMAETAKMVKFSNRSTVQPFNRFNHLFIAHDDLDLPLGSFKIQFATGPRLHKGMLSIEQVLGTKNFWRVRIGVEGRRKKEEGRRPSGEEYVLQPFRHEEKTILIKTFHSIRPALLKHITKSVRSDTFSD